MAIATSRRSSLRRRVIWSGIATVIVIVISAALYLEPWKLVIDRHVNQPFPGSTAAGRGTAEVVARGEFISHEHKSKGSALVIKMPDGSRVLRLENLDTSDGPRLVVRLSSAPVVEGKAGWKVFTKGTHVDLGELAGNLGSSNYPIADSVDLTKLTSVSIWCARFNVSFAAAALQPAS